MSNHSRTQARIGGGTSSCFCSLGYRGTAGTQGPEKGGMAGEGWLVDTNLLLGTLPGLPSFILEQEWGSCGDLTAAIVPVKKTLFGQ